MWCSHDVSDLYTVRLGTCAITPMVFPALPCACRRTVLRDVYPVPVSANRCMTGNRAFVHKKTKTPSMPSTTLPKLSEDELDDVLYFSRIGDLAELKVTIETCAKRFNVPLHDIMLAAIEDGSGNGPLHMASANGHNGMLVRHLVRSPPKTNNENHRDPNIHPITLPIRDRLFDPDPPKRLRQHGASLGVAKRSSRRCQIPGASRSRPELDQPSRARRGLRGRAQWAREGGRVASHGGEGPGCRCARGN